MAKTESGVFVRGNSMKKDIEISKYTKRIRFGFNLKKYISKCLFKMTCEAPSCKYVVKHDSIRTDIISSSFQPSVPVSLLLWISSMILSLGARCPLSPTLSPSFFFFSLLPLPSFPFPPLLLSETAVRCYHWAWWNISAALNGGHRLRDSSLTADFQITFQLSFQLQARVWSSLHSHFFLICLFILGNGTPDQPRWGTPSAPDRLCALASHWGPGTYHDGVGQLQSETRPYEELGQSANLSILLSTHL